MPERDLLESDALHAFGVFAEHRNFTAAAGDLQISQPSLHIKIRKLAAALGTALYQRQGRSLVLTEPGERLAAFALDTRRRADDFLAVLHGGAGLLTIAAGRGTLRWVVGDAVQAVTAAGRKVRVITANRDGAVAALASGRADVAVIAYDPPPAGLRAAQVASCRQVLVIPESHELAQRRKLSLRDLDGLDLVVPPPGRPHRLGLERALADAGVSWQAMAEADGWDLLVQLAGWGVGAAVVNGCVRPPAGLAAVPIAGLPAVRYWAVWRPQRQALAAGLLAGLGVDAAGGADDSGHGRCR